MRFMGSAMPGPDEVEAAVSLNPAQGSKNKPCSKISVKFLTSSLPEILFWPYLGCENALFIPVEIH